MNWEALKHSLRNIRLRKLLNANQGWWIGFVGIAVAILAWMVYRERDTLLQYPWQVKGDWLALSVFFHLLTILFQGIVWHLMITRFTGVKRLWLDFQVYAISFVSRRIPGPVWQIGSRFALYPAELVPSNILVIVTGLEVGLVGVAGVVCYLLFSPLYTFTYQWPWQAFFAGGAVALGVLFMRPGIMIDLTNRMLKALGRPAIAMRISRRDLLVWLLLYVFTWFLDGASLYFWVISILWPAPNFIDLVGISTISALVSYAAQFLPTGFALKEITMSSLLSLSIPISVGVIVAVGYRVFMLLFEILLALVTRFTLPNQKSAGR